MSKPILCLDFDGVIHSYTSGWKGIDVVADPPVPGAFNFLERASRSFKICILSSRSHQEGGIEAMKKWLYHHALEWREQKTLKQINDHKMQELVVEGSFTIDVDDSWIFDIDFPKEKPSAFLTIDDRALTFTGIWPNVDDLLKFKPWYKR